MFAISVNEITKQVVSVLVFQ